MSHRKWGFTLIELLVVIAIIGIIAAILFPVFAQARRSGWKTTCLSNVKQIGAGLAMYTQDYDEKIVPWGQPTEFPRDSVRSDRNTWVHLTNPYVKNGLPDRLPNMPINSNVPPKGVWLCPSFNMNDILVSSNRADCNGVDNIDPNDFARQYYAHYSIVYPNPGGPQGSCTAEDPHYNYPGSDPLFSQITGGLAEVSRPAETVLLTDGITAMSNIPNWSIYALWGCSSAQSHPGGGVHGFVDGHVKLLIGNSERVEATDSFGCVYKKYYSIDR